MKEKKIYTAEDGIAVKDVNGNTMYIQKSFLNELLINACSINFNEDTQEASLVSLGYKFSLSPQKVEITTPKGEVKGSSGSVGYGSRNYCESGERRVSLSRMWCLIKAIHYNALSINSVGDWVHNHKDNKGKDEAEIKGFSGLDVDNYELCSDEENKRHGHAWNKIFNTLDIEVTLSVYKDAELINIINSMKAEAYYNWENKRKFRIKDSEKLIQILKIYNKI